MTLLPYLMAQVKILSYSATYMRQDCWPAELYNLRTGS